MSKLELLLSVIAAAEGLLLAASWLRPWLRRRAARSSRVVNAATLVRELRARRRRAGGEHGRR